MGQILFREITAYCEKEARQMTYDVAYEELLISGTKFPVYKPVGVQCGCFRLCPHRRECTVNRTAHRTNP